MNHKKRSSGYRQKLIQSKVHSLENMSKKLGTLLDCAMQEENHGILQLIIYNEKGQVAVFKMLLVVSHHPRFGNLSPVCTVSAVVDWNT